MIGDVITIRPEYTTTAETLYSLVRSRLVTHLHPTTQRCVVLIGGESGSGKSVTAVCLAKVFEANNHTSSILHLDDYFALPPASNHAQRVADISQVGPQEVRLAVLQQHVDAFTHGANFVRKPLSHYKENIITEETLDWRGVRVLIVEGTYSLMLRNADFRIFMRRTYLDTQSHRAARARAASEQSAFIEQVLAIEHTFVAPTGASADAVVEKDYSVTTIMPHQPQ
jgi:uridine kinase